MEMSPICMRAGSRRRGAAKKAVMAACRISATVGSKGSVGGSERGVSPVACMGAVSVVASLVEGMTGGVRDPLRVYAVRLEETPLEGWECDKVRLLKEAI